MCAFLCCVYFVHSSKDEKKTTAHERCVWRSSIPKYEPNEESNDWFNWCIHDRTKVNVLRIVFEWRLNDAFVFFRVYPLVRAWASESVVNSFGHKKRFVWKLLYLVGKIHSQFYYDYAPSCVPHVSILAFTLYRFALSHSFYTRHSSLTHSASLSVSLWFWLCHAIFRCKRSCLHCTITNTVFAPKIHCHMSLVCSQLLLLPSLPSSSSSLAFRPYLIINASEKRSNR